MDYIEIEFYTLILLFLAVAYKLECSPERHYLRRADLLSFEESAHVRLLESRNDSSYLTAFGLNVAAFNRLHQHFLDFLPPENEHGRPRLLPPKSILGLVLQHLTSPSYHKELSQIYGIPGATTSRMITLGLKALAALFTERLGDWSIRFPSDDMKRAFAATVQRRQPLLEGVFGFVDGLNLRVEEPGDPDLQNAYYNGWLSDCYNSQVSNFYLSIHPRESSIQFAFIRFLCSVRGGKSSGSRTTTPVVGTTLASLDLSTKSSQPCPSPSR